MTTPSPKRPASIHVHGLTRRFGRTLALDDLSLDVQPGELFGVIGPDGAGKSTLFRILVTVLLPDAGGGTIDGLDLLADYREIRKHVGYMPGRFSLYMDLTVEENLKFFASVFGTTIEAEYRFIAPIYSQIEPFKNRRAGALSGGMKQKLALSCTLVHRPRVLLLDEPTTGVDAVSRAEFWDMLDELKAAGITTVVSTPYMDEAARCDRVALMQGGRFLREPDAPGTVSRQHAAPLVRVHATGDRPRLLASLRQSPDAVRAEVFGEWIHVSGMPSSSASELASHVRHHLDMAGWRDPTVEPIAATIEDVFIDLMGGPHTLEER